MSEGYEPKPIPLLVTQSQVTLPTSVVCTAGNKTTILDNVLISSLEYQALDPMPSNRTLVGAVYLFTNNSWMIPVDILVDKGSQRISVVVYNPTSTTFTIERIRLLMFWE